MWARCLTARFSRGKARGETPRPQRVFVLLMPSDPFLPWLDALDERHMGALTFQELRRGVQALSSIYVERREVIGKGSAFDGAGKRAAFACYFAPFHFLLIREIVRALGAVTRPSIVDIGCGSGGAGAAWALEMDPRP